MECIQEKIQQMPAPPKSQRFSKELRELKRVKEKEKKDRIRTQRKIKAEKVQPMRIVQNEMMTEEKPKKSAMSRRSRSRNKSQRKNSQESMGDNIRVLRKDDSTKSIQGSQIFDIRIKSKKPKHNPFSNSPGSNKSKSSYHKSPGSQLMINSNSDPHFMNTIGSLEIYKDQTKLRA